MVESHESSSPPLRERRIIWFSFLSSPIAYGLIANFVFAGREPDPDASLGMWWVIAAGFGVASILVPRLLGGSVLPHTLRIMGWSLAEAVAVLGLVSVIVTGAPVSSVYPFLGVAMVLIAFQFPRE